MEYSIMIKYAIGSLVCSIAGETDSKHNEQDRSTGSHAWGYIESYSPYCGYYVNFLNGTRVCLEEFELDESRDYQVITPLVMVGRLTEILDFDASLNRREECPDGDSYNDVLSILAIKFRS